MDRKSKIWPKPKYLLLQLHSLEAKNKAKITSSLTVRFSSFKGTLCEPQMSQPWTTFYPSGQLGNLHLCTNWCPRHPSLGLNSGSYTIILSSGSSGSACGTNTQNLLFQETGALGISSISNHCSIKKGWKSAHWVMRMLKTEWNQTLEKTKMEPHTANIKS